MDLNKLPSSLSNNNQKEKNQNQSAEEVYFSILVANKYNILDLSYSLLIKFLNIKQYKSFQQYELHTINEIFKKYREKHKENIYNLKRLLTNTKQKMILYNNDNSKNKENNINPSNDTNNTLLYNINIYDNEDNIDNDYELISNSYSTSSNKSFLINEDNSNSQTDDVSYLISKIKEEEYKVAVISMEITSDIEKIISKSEESLDDNMNSLRYELYLNKMLADSYFFTCVISINDDISEFKKLCYMKYEECVSKIDMLSKDDYLYIDIILNYSDFLIRCMKDYEKSRFLLQNTYIKSKELIDYCYLNEVQIEKEFISLFNLVEERLIVYKINII